MKRNFIVKVKFTIIGEFSIEVEDREKAYEPIWDHCEMTEKKRLNPHWRMEL